MHLTIPSIEDRKQQQAILRVGHPPRMPRFSLPGPSLRRNLVATVRLPPSPALNSCTIYLSPPSHFEAEGVACRVPILGPIG